MALSPRKEIILSPYSGFYPDGTRVKGTIFVLGAEGKTARADVEVVMGCFGEKTRTLEEHLAVVQFETRREMRRQLGREVLGEIDLERECQTVKVTSIERRMSIRV